MEEQGFIIGAIAASISKAKNVAFIGGQEMPPILAGEDGFKQGVEYIDPSIKVTTVMTGTMDDVAKVKQSTLAVIQSGADVVSGMANQAGMGIVDAAKDSGTYSVGVNSDQNSLAPDQVVVSVLKEVYKLYTAVYKRYAANELKSEVFTVGAKDDIFYLSDWHGFDTKMPEVKEVAERVMKDLSEGKIVVNKR